MLPPSITNKSLAELNALGPYGECDSPVGERIRTLSRTPLREFSSEDLAFLLRQSAGLQFVVPLALDELHPHPLTHRDYYPGVLLVAALGVDQKFWREHPQLRAELDEIAQHTLASLRGRSHKTQEKFRITFEALTKAMTPLLLPRRRSNQAMERTATRRAFTVCVISPFSLRPARALGGRRSSTSR